MAHHKSAKTRIRRNNRRDEINTARKSEMRSAVKKVIKAVEAGDKTTASAALSNATSQLQSKVSKGVIHKNTAARAVSRLAKRVAKAA